jgi:hypothetical protein
VTGATPRGLLADPEQLSRIVTQALVYRAQQCTRLAASRKMSGPRNANSRAAIRTEGAACTELAATLQDGVTALLLASIAAAIKDGTA